MKEKDLLKRITDMADRFSWRWWHVPSPMRATRDGKWVGAKEAAGLCDLVLIHDDPPRMILAEVKGDGGKLSDAQTEFLRLARNVAEASGGGSQSLDFTTEPPTYSPSAAIMGVYVFTPGNEAMVEAMLRSKVLPSA